MNNLGGVGPNADDDPVLRYAHVTEKDERPVDLVVSVRDGHEYLTADNFAEYQGAWEMFGQINVRDDSTAHLTFSFVDSETSEPVVLERFYVTVFDIDQQRSENRHTERLCVDNDQYDEYVLRESASLVSEAQDTACDGSEGSSVTFQSTEAGFICFLSVSLLFKPGSFDRHASQVIIPPILKSSAESSARTSVARP